MNFQIKIQAKYQETYLYHEPDTYPIENIVASIVRNGTHIPFEKITFDDISIFIHKHKLFSYILAFEKPYNRERFL